MSAFQVSPKHIAALVTVWARGPSDGAARWTKPNGNKRAALNMDERAAFEMLSIENAKSVGYRYNESTKPVEYVPLSFGARSPTIVEALKLLDCYEYQSCERPEWAETETFRWCYRLRKALCQALPGYSDSNWEA